MPRQSCRVQYKEGDRERQKKRWEDNIPEWTGMTLGAVTRKARGMEGAGSQVICGAPTVH